MGHTDELCGNRNKRLITNMSDSDHQYYSTIPAESQGAAADIREILYEFGRVRLEWSDDPPRFYAMQGDTDLMAGLPPGAERNPYTALAYFVQGVREELRPRIKRWLESSRGNPVTGCRVNLPCSECRRAGLGGAETGCPRIQK